MKQVCTTKLNQAHPTALYLVTTHNSIEGNAWRERASRRQKTEGKKMALPAVTDEL